MYRRVNPFAESVIEAALNAERAVGGTVGFYPVFGLKYVPVYTNLTVDSWNFRLKLYTGLLYRQLYN